MFIFEHSGPSAYYPLQLMFTVVYLRGLCDPLHPTPLAGPRRDFCNYSGIILALFSNKIAATKVCVFGAAKCYNMRLRPGLCPGPRWGSLQRPSAANLFTVDSRRVLPAR